MIDQELAQSLKAWPFKEALQIIKKMVVYKTLKFHLRDMYY